MIQDIYPHIFDNQYKDTSIRDDDFIIIKNEDGFLMKEDLSFPRASELDIKGEFTYLFSIDEDRYFFYDGLINDAKGLSFKSLMEIRRHDPQDKKDAFSAFTAHHLIGWYKDNSCCGRCGKKMKKAEKERALICDCGNIVYPRINPAVIVGVINRDKILITKYRNGYGGNALVAGFAEIGETLEETVRREVKEETGLDVENIRYYRSQPWGIAADILTGFYCDVKGDDTIRMEENELKYACFVDRDDIVLQESDFSLTNEMMKRFKEGEDC